MNIQFGRIQFKHYRNVDLVSVLLHWLVLCHTFFVL